MIPHLAKPANSQGKVAGRTGTGQRTGKRQCVPMKLKEPKDLNCLDCRIIMGHSLLKVKQKAAFSVSFGVLALYEEGLKCPCLSQGS